MHISFFPAAKKLLKSIFRPQHQSISKDFNQIVEKIGETFGQNFGFGFSSGFYKSNQNAR